MRLSPTFGAKPGGKDEKPKRPLRLAKLLPYQIRRSGSQDRMFLGSPQETAFLREAAPLNDLARYTLARSRQSLEPLHTVIHGPSDLREAASLRVLQLFHWIKLECQMEASRRKGKASLAENIEAGLRYLRKQLPITAVELDYGMYRRASQEAFERSPVDLKNVKCFIRGLATPEDKALFKAIWKHCFQPMKSRRNSTRKLWVTKPPLRKGFCRLVHGDMLAHAQNTLPNEPFPENTIAVLARNSAAYLGADLSSPFGYERKGYEHLMFNDYLRAIGEKILPNGVLLYGESEIPEMMEEAIAHKGVLFHHKMRPALPTEIAWMKHWPSNLLMAPLAWIKTDPTSPFLKKD